MPASSNPQLKLQYGASRTYDACSSAECETNRWTTDNSSHVQRRLTEERAGGSCGKKGRLKSGSAILKGVTDCESQIEATRHSDADEARDGKNELKRSREGT